MNKPVIDILMLTYNRLEYTKATLESLEVHTSDWPYRLIITDNGSTDGTIDYLNKQFDRGFIHKLVLMPENLGNAGGKNYELMELAETDYICLLDNDMLLQPGWLSKPMAAMLHFAKKKLVLMSPWPIWKFAPNTHIGDLKDKKHNVFLTRKLSGQVWIGKKQPLIECGGFKGSKDGRFMGFFASPLAKELVKRGYNIGCIADEELAISMDRAGSPLRINTAEMELYREWNKLQKNKHQLLPDFHIWRDQRGK